MFVTDEPILTLENKKPSVYPPSIPLFTRSLDKIYIPLRGKEDKILWQHSHDGNLSFKDKIL